MVNYTYDGRLLFANYVLGADGIDNSVRRACCIPFEGYTWQDFQIMGAQIEYHFANESGFTPFKFLVDPRYWAVIVRISHKHQWHIAYAEFLELSDSKAGLIVRSRKRLKKYMEAVKLSNHRIGALPNVPAMCSHSP